MTGSCWSRTPNVARIYDWLLGGKDNYEEDRAAARRLLAAIPDVQAGARANREFLGRAVRFLVQEAGVRQFIDIGSGLPAMGNVHEVAHSLEPAARVAYLDIDPVVVSHARALLCQVPLVCAIAGDVRDPAAILGHPDLRGQIDRGQPAAILLVALLHFIPDDQGPYRAVEYLKDVLVPGSYLVISHGTGDCLSTDAIEQMRQVYEGASAPAMPRARTDIARFFDGLELVAPGLVDVAAWRAHPRPGLPDRTLFLGGVGRKP